MSDYKNYSVLMSVYIKEKPEYLKTSMESILKQSVKTDDFVLVCDGPLNAELDQVILDMKQSFGEILHIIRLDTNQGLGNALNIGIRQCKNEIVARMDSDDISDPARCQKQLLIFQDPNISICSCTISEFQETPDHVTGRRVLPANQAEILKYSRKRNPFNHPAVMFKKSAVEASGGYSEKFPLFEDYYLWIRMLMKGYKGTNIKEPLLYMRTSTDMYRRRGGKSYAGNMLKFHLWLLKSHWTTFPDFASGALPHAIVCILPNQIRSAVYKKLH